jgi:hypothetical protein
VASRAMVMQHRTQRPVQFEITPATRDAVQKWIKLAALKSDDFTPSRLHDSPHLGTRQYARILEGWVQELGLDPAEYGTHSMRRTKATLIYRRTKNLRAVQLLTRITGGHAAAFVAWLQLGRNNVQYRVLLMQRYLRLRVSCLASRTNPNEQVPAFRENRGSEAGLRRRRPSDLGMPPAHPFMLQTRAESSSRCRSCALSHPPR